MSTGSKRWKQIAGALSCTLSAPLVLASSASMSAPSSFDLLTTLGSLVLVIGVILLLAWLLKRMQVPAFGQQKGFNACVLECFHLQIKVLIRCTHAGITIVSFFGAQGGAFPD